VSPKYILRVGRRRMFLIISTDLIDFYSHCMRLYPSGGKVARKRFRLDPIGLIRAEAIGQPGKRTFFILAADDSGAIRVKTEKRQLEMLSLGIKQVLEQVANLPPARAEIQGERLAVTWPGELDVAFEVGQVGIGYEERRDLIMLILYDAEETSRRSPTFVGWATRQQMESFGQEIDAVCAAGRPLCPLCQGPMDPTGHVCPRSNGHAQLA